MTSPRQIDGSVRPKPLLCRLGFHTNTLLFCRRCGRKRGLWVESAEGVNISHKTATGANDAAPTD